MATILSSPLYSHTTAQVLLALTSLVVGFRLGSTSSQTRPLASVPDIPPSESRIQKATSEDAAALEAEPEPDQEAQALEEATDGDLADIVPGVWEPCKLVLVVRTDLKMSPGDIAAQCSAATLACYKILQRKNPHLIRHWEITGQAKIALRGNSEEQLLELEAIAKSLNLCARTVYSNSSQKSEGDTRTRAVLGVGPAPSDLANKVTGKLKLL